MQNIVFEKIGLFFLMISAFDDFLQVKYFQKTFYKQLFLRGVFCYLISFEIQKTPLKPFIVRLKEWLIDRQR